MIKTEKLIKNIITKILCVKTDQIIPQASFVEDLGADSLDEIEILMTIEDEFDIEILDYEAEKMKTVNDVIKYIEEKI